jgi:hypothetical protein
MKTKHNNFIVKLSRIGSEFLESNKTTNIALMTPERPKTPPTGSRSIQKDVSMKIVKIISRI